MLNEANATIVQLDLEDGSFIANDHFEILPFGASSFAVVPRDTSIKIYKLVPTRCVKKIHMAGDFPRPRPQGDE